MAFRKFGDAPGDGDRKESSIALVRELHAGCIYKRLGL